MIQYVLTFCIVAAAIGYAIHRCRRTIFSNHPCQDCHGCCSKCKKH